MDVLPRTANSRTSSSVSLLQVDCAVFCAKHNCFGPPVAVHMRIVLSRQTVLPFDSGTSIIIRTSTIIEISIKINDNITSGSDAKKVRVYATHLFFRTWR